MHKRLRFPYEIKRLPGRSCGLRFEVLSSLDLFKVGRPQPGTDTMSVYQIHLYIWGY